MSAPTLPFTGPCNTEAEIVWRLRSCGWDATYSDGTVEIAPIHHPSLARMVLWLAGVETVVVVCGTMSGLSVPSLVRVLVEVTSWAGDAA